MLNPKRKVMDLPVTVLRIGHRQQVDLTTEAVESWLQQSYTEFHGQKSKINIFKF
jgi:hypothetical protein